MYNLEVNRDYKSLKLVLYKKWDSVNQFITKEEDDNVHIIINKEETCIGTFKILFEAFF